MSKCEMAQILLSILHSFREDLLKTSKDVRVLVRVPGLFYVCEGDAANLTAEDLSGVAFDMENIGK